MDVKAYTDHLLSVGLKYLASDLYILPCADHYQLSFRLQQMKIIQGELKTADAEKIILYFKYLAEMDVGERRKIQAGSTSLVVNDQSIRLRFSTVADHQQRESIVIRFLYDFQGEKSLNYFLPYQQRDLEHLMKKRGLYLFSGPIGSGKTTTMYKLAKKEALKNKQVITIEDPVEIEENLFLQLQTNEKIQITYDSLVQVSLRHRPDILIVGEIRDEQTAAAVVRGALTGHTVFSTVHAPSIEGVIARLAELGVSRSDLKQVLCALVYQRILPVRCPLCGETRCSPICDHILLEKKQAVLYDIYAGPFSNQEQIKSNWSKLLRKVWCYGYITKETYLAEAIN